MGRLVFVVLPRYLLGGLMLIGVALVFANVVGRYVFSAPLFWAEEVLVYLVIWGVFVGMASIAYNGDHLTMDLFHRRLSPGLARGVNAAIALGLVAVSVFVAWQSWQVVTLFWNIGQVSIAAGIPKALPHAAIAVGFGLTALAVLLRWRSYLSGKF
ncbi:MAG: TRAP transporter small permease [Alphaproteobacteria bacterium]|nr:TRAP transporter small permease [Alphaproteobacteria bacterium]